MKIEKNVPTPAVRHSRANTWMENMEIGDSVLVKSKAEATRITSAFFHRKIRPLVRTLDGGKVRIWRVA